jgi:hypothetical protein
VTRHGCERGELFEGSMASRGARPALHPRTNSPTAFGWPTVVIRGERVSAKRGEPHDRQRDATSPRTFARRKPSRWCETTRTERGRTGGAVGPTRASGQPGARLEWTREVMSVEGHEQRTPGEAGPRCPLGAPAPGAQHREGPGYRADASRECTRGGNLVGCRETVTECRRRMVRHPEATPRCCPRGPRAGNGRRPRRAQGRTHRPAHRDPPHRGRSGRRGSSASQPGGRGDPDAGIARRRSAGLVDHPSLEAALTSSRRASRGRR